MTFMQLVAFGVQAAKVVFLKPPVSGSGFRALDFGF